MAETSVKALSSVLGITPQRIQQLTKEGMPKADHGKYDVTACTTWYIAWMQKQLARRQDSAVRDETIQWTRERTRLAKEQADTSYLRNEELRGELVRLTMVKEVVGYAISIFRAKALALSSKIAPECEGRTVGEIKAVIEREARQLLEAIASFDFRAKADRASADDDVPEGAAAAAPDGEPVGRRASNPKPRGKRRARKVAD